MRITCSSDTFALSALINKLTEKQRDIELELEDPIVLEHLFIGDISSIVKTHET